MSGPLIPYIELPELPLLGQHTIQFLGRTQVIGPWTIKPFGALVATGVYVGILLATHYARKRGMNTEAMSRFMFWVLVSAFVSGHVLDTIFYHPTQVLEDPMSLVRLWDGLSSFGGFIGAVIGVLLFKYYFKVKNVLAFADTMGAAFPVGWTFGRMGCSVVHDHPGMRSDLWFAVQYPHGGRFDLGLYEMLFAFIVAVVCLILARRTRPPGFFLGLMMLVYAPVRFALDFLRVQPGELSGADPRYLSLTPAQWASMAMAGFGFYLLHRAADSGQVGNDPYVAACDGLDPRLTARSSAKPATGGTAVP